MKRIIIAILVLLLGLVSISYGLDLKSTADYLSKQQLDEWGILALYSYGIDVTKQKLESVYQSDITTDYEAYIMGAIPKGAAVSNYAQKVIDTQRSDGKFADFLNREGQDLVNSHVWGIISLYAANRQDYNKEQALKWLENQQNRDGGFPVYVGDEFSDLDMTAMALIALDILGHGKGTDVSQKAIRFIENTIKERETCETIAWYIMARVKLGLDVGSELYQSLMEHKMPDGSFKHYKIARTGNYMATWHALLALQDYQNEYSIITKLHNLNKFSDVKEWDVSYKAIMELLNRGIISGYPDNTFRPEKLVTRAEFAKLLIYGLNLNDQLINNNSVINESGFTDLKNHWAKDIVNFAVSKGYLQGIEEAKFAPDNNITGAQVAAIIVRAKGLETTASALKGTHWYDGYVRMAQQYGLLYQGFNAEAYATRAQCAVTIQKLLN